MSSWTEMPPYSITIAVSDVNTWAVIFCGFIVYVIWGIVFDMVMTAYSELRSNKNEIKKIQAELNSKKSELAKESAKIAPLRAEINNLTSKIEDLNRRIMRDSVIDTQKMKVALADYFAGWMSILTALGHGEEQHKKAQLAYDNAMNTYFQTSQQNDQQ